MAADRIIDLAAWRARRAAGPLPPELLDEIDAAGRVYDALLAQGHELRFELPRAGGRVRAELRTLDGEHVREVSLAEVVGLECPPAAPAAC